MIRIPKWLLVVVAFALVVGLAVPAFAAETKGKLKSINADKKEFVMTDENGKDWTFHLTDNAKVRLNEQDKRISDLKSGDQVHVTYEKKDDRLVASEIRCDRK